MNSNQVKPYNQRRKGKYRSQNKVTSKKPSARHQAISSGFDVNDKNKIRKSKSREGQFYLKLCLVCLLTLFVMPILCASCGSQNGSASSINTATQSETPTELANAGEKSQSTMNETNSEENIRPSYSSGDLKKINRGMSVIIIWLPLIVSILFISSLVLIHQSPESRGNLLINGVIIVACGVFMLAMLTKFDDITAWALPQQQSDPLRRQITFISNVISIIQIAVGVNVFSTGLTLQPQKGKPLELADEIKMLRQEVRMLRTGNPTWQRQDESTSEN